MALGAQNAFILRQGLKKERVPTVVLISWLCDSFLIAIGVNGLGGLFTSHPGLIKACHFAGAAFLFYHSQKSFRAAFSGGSLVALREETPNQNWKNIALQSAGFSLLNPHSLLDTVVLIGTVGAKFGADERPLFFFGATSASLAWFSSLGFGAAKLAPLVCRPKFWKGLDIFVGILMLGIALSLIRSGVEL